jgi:hypothetical protein
MMYLIRVGASVAMGLPESVTYLLLVVLGYALTRVADLCCAWLRTRFHATSSGQPPTTAFSTKNASRTMG